MGNQRERISEAPHQAKRRSLRVVYFNARSIVNKINEVRLYILDNDPDVIAITETWTHNGISNDYLDIANYHIASRHDRQDTMNGRGGGLLIYVKKQWKSCEVDTHSQFNQLANSWPYIFQHEGPLCRSWALIQSESFLFSNQFSHYQSPRPRTMEFKQK